MEQQTSLDPSQPLVTSSSIKSNLPLIIGGIVLLLLVAVGSYMLGSRSVKTGQNTKLASTTEVSHVTPTDSIVIPTITDSTNPVSPTALAIPSSAINVISLVDIARSFFVGYNSCIIYEDKNPSGENRIKVCGEKYAQYLTASMHETLERYYTTPFDPILCSQAYYNGGISVKADIEESTRASVIVNASFEPGIQPRSIKLNFIKSNTDWFLNEVVCPKI